jgi:threonylcarbamoyladenosine tRNA methylthiotransferase MtaB
LQEFVNVDGVDRIRISSIEPNLITPELIRFVAENEKMCNHFHIPLQSGDDTILRRMRRRYTTRQYADLIHNIKRNIPDCGIGVDVIVGFPGETDAHFERTHLFLNELPVSYLHVFTYSERPNTPAAQFDHVVEPKVRFKRNEMLRTLGYKKKSAFYAGMVNKTASVLMESEIEGETRLGFTGNYVRVGLPANKTNHNTVVPVDILGVQNGVCVGRISGQREAA